MIRSGPLAVTGFALLLLCFALVARHFGVAVSPAVALSFALLLAPYWAFGFGAAGWLLARLPHGRIRVFLVLLPMVAYLAFALPEGRFRWDMFLGMSFLLACVGLLLQHAQREGKSIPGWQDWLVLALLGISVDLHFFDRAWPVAGLTGLSKLVFVDAGLYGYLVIRPMPGIGFDFRPRLADFADGLREFVYYTPVAIPLGFALRFLHFHPTLPGVPAFAAGWLFTMFFVALPEELFFRGLLLNMLEKRIGTRRALVLSSLLFGLAHFNKRTTFFNWRYVLMAAIAGAFYGRAWLSRRRLMASSITHTTVDTVWSIWLR